MDAVGRLLDELETVPSSGVAQLRKLKAKAAKRSGAAAMPRTDQLLGRYRGEVREGLRPADRRLERSLVLNPIRSSSGVATVTVLTKPYPCPGRCVYCPTEVKAPKSYLLTEPAVKRALSDDYDPTLQVEHRLKALENTGHATDKIELIVKGGTWSFYPESYQQGFLQRCFDAANQTDSLTLQEAQSQNETAQRRIIGLTVETRPDYVTPEEILRLRALGVTRVELGVQSLDDAVLKLTVRDHTTREIREASRLLRDAGFKIAYHLMPNLPGSSPEGDLETFRKLFADPAYRPDQLKIYPCAVVESAELSRWWLDGRYRPYDEESLLELVVQVKGFVPPYVRIERIARDIATPSVLAGNKRPNLRQEALSRLKGRGLTCRCIRCREVRDQVAGEFQLVRREYEASEGKEIFLSFEAAQGCFEAPATDRLAALLRLRVPSFIFSGASHWIPELDRAAIVRELHTYGWQLPLEDKNRSAAQHRGFGRRLMAEAERITREEFGLPRIAVIAGIGVRPYYRRLGYTLDATYMVKPLTQVAWVK